jgi:CubicO group peptidase (beta-lactamase class C family)
MKRILPTQMSKGVFRPIGGVIASLLFVCLSSRTFGDLEAAAAYSAQRSERALLVWQNGRLILERYSSPEPSNREHIFSITKSLCALGAFAAFGRRPAQLDEPVSLTLTEWQNHPQKRRITLRNLLNQTSGLSPGFEALYAANVRDKNQKALNLPMTAAPGEKFAYGPSHYEVLEIFMARKLGESPLTWMERALFGPLGIRPGGWRRDRLGNPYFSAGAQVSARNLLAVGHLIRRKGWHWIFPLVPSSPMRQVSLGSAPNPIYGLGFWLNRLATEKTAVEIDVEEAISARADWDRACLSRSAPADMIAMVGSRGQRVYVSPSSKLVIVRLGSRAGFRDPDFLRRFFR